MTASPVIRYPYEIDRSQYAWPTFSDAEFARRHALVRGFMAEHELDCLLVTGSSALWERSWANVRWLSNYIGTMELDACVIVPADGEPTLAVLGLNARLPDRVARSVIPDVRGALNTSSVIVGRLKELGIDSGRIGIVKPAPWLSIPADHRDALTDAFPRAQLVEFSDEFWTMRLVLSPEELACLEEAGRIGDRAVEAVIAQLKPGMAERDLFRIIYDSFAGDGAEIPCMVLAGSEDMRAPTSGFQRPRPIDRTITDHDVLLLELGARDPHGYEAQTGKPIVFGAPPPDFEDLFDVMFTAYERVTAALKPGCTAADLRAAGAVITERGYQVVAPLVHGVFNPIDAGPFVGTSHRPDKDIRLEPGMACCVEIHPCSADVRKGVFLGDTFVITEDGARSVNHLPPVLTRI
ncbi:hypothetical protein BJF78_30285 [Pseudonocardia sp. CNS-139]|nr:hypothetical protein BJF78_30285 [Pseudonocardia sp. CNS-139]